MSESGGSTVAVLPIDDSNKILLVKNSASEKKISDEKSFNKPEGWGMPRGRKEAEDKDVIATAERECREETGYEVKIDSRYRTQESAGDHIHIAFIGYPVAGKGKLEINTEELTDGRWFPQRVLWTLDKSNKDYLNMHPRQRRMAQKLMQQRSRG